MTSDDVMRASDGDREHAADMLRNAYVAGRIDLAELHDRAGAAYSAKTWGELRGLTSIPGGRCEVCPRAAVRSSAGVSAGGRGCLSCVRG